MQFKTIILAGSGHAHLEILKDFTEFEVSKFRFLLISPQKETYYSGLIPRMMAGDITAKDMSIPSAHYAERKGFNFIQDSVQSLHLDQNAVTLESGKFEHFDILSLNTGGERIEIPSESPSQTVYLRPFDSFIQKWQSVSESLSSGTTKTFVVIGGGAAAVEVATALRIRLNKNFTSQGEVHLFCKGKRLCESYSEKISSKILKSLLAFKIHVYLNEPVQQIYDGFINTNRGEKLKFDYIFVVTPTGPSALLTEKINSKLQLSGNVFAAGDATEMQNQPTLPRSGVIAVHQGRHLAQNLRKILSGQRPIEFKIRKNQLNILITGEKKARLILGNLTWEGAFPYSIKSWIDKRYMKSFS